MSFAAYMWVLKHGFAMCANAAQFATLVRIADHTDDSGRGCWTSQQTLSDELPMSRATVKRAIDELAQAGVIVPGDPALVAHLRKDKRPQVWDLAMDRRITRGRSDPSSRKSPSSTRGQTDPSLKGNGGSKRRATGGQIGASRRVNLTPKPVIEPAIEPNPSDQNHNQNQNPAPTTGLPMQPQYAPAPTREPDPAPAWATPADEPEQEDPLPVEDPPIRAGDCPECGIPLTDPMHDVFMHNVMTKNAYEEGRKFARSALRPGENTL